MSSWWPASDEKLTVVIRNFIVEACRLNLHLLAPLTRAARSLDGSDPNHTIYHPYYPRIFLPWSITHSPPSRLSTDWLNHVSIVWILYFFFRKAKHILSVHSGYVLYITTLLFITLREGRGGRALLRYPIFFGLYSLCRAFCFALYSPRHDLMWRFKERVNQFFFYLFSSIVFLLGSLCCLFFFFSFGVYRGWFACACVLCWRERWELDNVSVSLCMGFAFFSFR